MKTEQEIEERIAQLRHVCPTIGNILLAAVKF